MKLEQSDKNFLFSETKVIKTFYFLKQYYQMYFLQSIWLKQMVII